MNHIVSQKSSKVIVDSVSHNVKSLSHFEKIWIYLVSSNHFLSKWMSQKSTIFCSFFIGILDKARQDLYTCMGKHHYNVLYP